MKSLRTYNMDHGVIRILNSKQNKSAFVNLAVMKLHSKEMHFELRNVSTRSLLASLLSRDDVSENLKAVIRLSLE